MKNVFKEKLVKKLKIKLKSLNLFDYKPKFLQLNKQKNIKR